MSVRDYILIAGYLSQPNCQIAVCRNILRSFHCNEGVTDTTPECHIRKLVLFLTLRP